MIVVAQGKRISRKEMEKLVAKLQSEEKYSLERLWSNTVYHVEEW